MWSEEEVSAASTYSSTLDLLPYLIFYKSKAEINEAVLY